MNVCTQLFCVCTQSSELPDLTIHTVLSISVTSFSLSNSAHILGSLNKAEGQDFIYEAKLLLCQVETLLEIFCCHFITYFFHLFCKCEMFKRILERHASRNILVIMIKIMQKLIIIIWPVYIHDTTSELNYWKCNFYFRLKVCQLEF